MAGPSTEPAAGIGGCSELLVEGDDVLVEDRDLRSEARLPLGDQLAACFTSRMMTGVWGFVGVLIGTTLVAWRARRTAARAAAGQAVFFPVGANRPDEGGRYSLGRVQAGREFQWEPRRSRTRLRELSADLRYVRAWQTTFGEMWRLPVGVLVIECESSAGPVRLWTRAQQAEQVVEMIRCANAKDVSKP
ncbi:hypothetical protein ABZ250_35310 [Streptomyces afghaniensis]|uniref:hypothetical protein n=1 Tax=Streptomyces afghaniensis TaxID=66865 RepID=UPI0033B2CBAF